MKQGVVAKILEDMEEIEDMDLDLAIELAKGWSDEDLDALVNSEEQEAWPLFRKLQLLRREDAWG